MTPRWDQESPAEAGLQVQVWTIPAEAFVSSEKTEVANACSLPSLHLADAHLPTFVGVCSADLQVKAESNRIGISSCGRWPPLGDPVPGHPAVTVRPNRTSGSVVLRLRSLYCNHRKEHSLKNFTRVKSKLIVVTAIATAALALAAAPALAVETAAKWSNTGSGMGWGGTLTLKKKGLSSTTCTFTRSVAQGTYFGGNYFWMGSGFAPISASCANSKKFTWAPMVGGWWTGTSYTNDLGDSTDIGLVEHESPYGPWVPDMSNFVIPFVNASGATPSKITFNNTRIGATLSGSEEITLTGSLNVTTASGSALTLSH